MTKALIFKPSGWSCSDGRADEVPSFDSRQISFGVAIPRLELELVGFDLDGKDRAEIKKQVKNVRIFFNQNNDEAAEKYRATKEKLIDGGRHITSPLKFYIDRVDTEKNNEGIRLEGNEIHFDHEDFSDFKIEYSEEGESEEQDEGEKSGSENSESSSSTSLPRHLDEIKKQLKNQNGQLEQQKKSLDKLTKQISQDRTSKYILGVSSITLLLSLISIVYQCKSKTQIISHLTGSQKKEADKR